MTDQTSYRLTVREWREGDRPREKLQALGAESLSDAELVGILLRTGSREDDAVAFGHNLLVRNGGLAGINRMSVGQLTEIGWMGLAKAASLKAAFELGRRAILADIDAKQEVRSSHDVASIFAARLRNLDHEQLHVVLLSSKNQVMKTSLVYSGSVNSALVRTGELFKEAVRENAVSIVVAHNHPSGDPTPSADDVRVTREMVQAGKLLQITVLDHLIIGDQTHGYVSLRERRLGFDGA